MYKTLLTIAIFLLGSATVSSAQSFTRIEWDVISKNILLMVAEHEAYKQNAYYDSIANEELVNALLTKNKEINQYKIAISLSDSVSTNNSAIAQVQKRRADDAEKKLRKSKFWNKVLIGCVILAAIL